MRSRTSRWVFIMMALFLSACTTGSSTTATPTAIPTGHIPSGPIKHIVFFVKENRTFDNYYGTYPGVNGATTAVDSAGKVEPLQHETDLLAGDIDHSSEAAVMAYDNGKMDEFDRTGFSRPLSINGTKNNAKEIVLMMWCRRG